jgi:signal transduction histidine kinase
MLSVSRGPLIRTLRARLTVLHLATLTLTLALFAVLAYIVLARTLAHHHDDELRRQAEDLVQALGNAPFTAANIQRASVQSGVGSRFVMLRNRRGGLIYRDAILAAAEPTLGQHQALVHAAAVGATAPEFFTVDLEDTGDVRFICAPVPGGEAYVQIGDPLGDLRSTQHAIALACLPLIPLVLVLSSYGGWMLANRALAPMRRVADTLDEIQVTSLARRVDVHVRDEEVSGLVSTINHLLDRLERAFDAMRQFAGDVSHQLQTPLTVLRGTAEAALRATDAVTVQNRMREVIGETDEMSATIASLRTFSLADAPVVDGRRVDLSDLVGEVSEVVAALGELRDVRVTQDIAGDVSTRGDAQRLKQVVLNLGDNAVKYTAPGGQVTIRLRSRPGEAVLQVIDTGVGVAPEHRDRLFDRLYRAAGPQARAGGSGLGLAIVKRILDAHGGTIQVESDPDKGSTFTVRLPASPRQS